MSIHSVTILNLLTGISAWGSRITLTLYALELGAQPLTIGLLAATYSVFPMLLTVPAGRIADRIGARWPLILVTICGGLGMLVPYWTPGLATLFIAAALLGWADGVCAVLLQNMVGILSNAENRTRNFSNFSMNRACATFVGPLAAGISIDYSGYAATCLYFALITLSPLAVLLPMRGDTPRKQVQKTPHAAGNMRSMLAVPGVRRVLATSSILNAGRDVFQFYVPVYAHSMGLSASTIGVVLAMSAIAVVFVRVIIPYLTARFKEEHVLAYAFTMGGVTLMLIPLTHNAILLAMVAFMFGLGMGCAQPIVMMLMFGNAPQGRSGEALGLRMSVNYLTKLVGPVAFGSIATALGLLPMFWLHALMLAAAARLSLPKSVGK